MSLDTSTLRSSFELVASRQPDFVLRFYEILFERYPLAQPLFGRNARENQAKMLTEALVAVLDHLEDSPWLNDTLRAMGNKHLDYGVTDEMYHWVGDSLLATLAEVAADDWSPAVRDAWTQAYGAIAGLMIAGARDARPVLS